MLMYIIYAQLFAVLYTQQISNDHKVNLTNQVNLNHGTIHLPINRQATNINILHPGGTGVPFVHQGTIQQSQSGTNVNTLQQVPIAALPGNHANIPLNNQGANVIQGPIQQSQPGTNVNTLQQVPIAVLPGNHVNIPLNNQGANVNQGTIQQSQPETNVNTLQQVPIAALPGNHVNIPLNNQGANVNFLSQRLFPTFNQIQQQGHQLQGNNLFRQQQTINPTIGNPNVDNSQVGSVGQTSFPTVPITELLRQNMLRSNQLPETRLSQVVSSGTGQTLPGNSPDIIQFIDPITRQPVSNIGSSLESINSDIKNKIESGLVNIVDLNHAFNLGMNIPNNLIPRILNGVSFHNTLHPVINDPPPANEINSNNVDTSKNIPASLHDPSANPSTNVGNVHQTSQLNTIVPRQTQTIEQLNTENIKTILSSNIFPSFPNVLPTENTNSIQTPSTLQTSEPVFISRENFNSPSGGLQNSFANDRNSVISNTTGNTGQQIVQQPLIPVFIPETSSVNDSPPLPFQQRGSTSHINTSPMLHHLPNFPPRIMQNLPLRPVHSKLHTNGNKNTHQLTDVNKHINGGPLNVLLNIPDFPPLPTNKPKAGKAEISSKFNKEESKIPYEIPKLQSSIPSINQGNPFKNLSLFPGKNELQRQELNDADSSVDFSDIQNVATLKPSNGKTVVSNLGRIHWDENGLSKSKMNNAKLNTIQRNKILNSFVQSIVKHQNKHGKKFQKVKSFPKKNRRENGGIHNGLENNLSNRQSIFVNQHHVREHNTNKQDNGVKNYKPNGMFPQPNAKTQISQMRKNKIKSHIESKTSIKQDKKNISYQKHRASTLANHRKNNGFKSSNNRKVYVKHNQNKKLNRKHVARLQKNSDTIHMGRPPNLSSFPSANTEPLVKQPIAKSLHSRHSDILQSKGSFPKDVKRQKQLMTKPEENFAGKPKQTKTGEKEKINGETKPLRSYRTQSVKNEPTFTEEKYGKTLPLRQYRSRMRDLLHVNYNHSLINVHNRNTEIYRNKQRNPQHSYQERTQYHKEQNDRYKGQSRTKYREESYINNRSFLNRKLYRNKKY